MSERLVYLDSSSVVKRYAEERGSDVVDTAYERAEAAAFRLVFSTWNIGEVLGAFNRYASKGALSEDELKTALKDFLSESIKMTRLNSLQILPITASSLLASWRLVLKHRIYQADALQVSTSKEAGCNLLLSADSKLVQVAREEAIEAIDIEAEPEKALSLLGR